MSLSPETLVDLMALADGELEGADLERVERLVGESEEARVALGAMRSPVVGDWLRGELGPRLAAADAIADTVMGRLEGASAPAPLVSLARSGVRRGRSRTPMVAGAAVAALALAAGVTLYVSSQGGTMGPRAPVASVAVPPVDVAPAPSALAERPSQGVEVDEVDSPSRGVSVFEIPVTASPGAAAKAAGPSSVVIMIEDDPGSK
jgi:hypothetical protein